MLFIVACCSFISCSIALYLRSSKSWGRSALAYGRRAAGRSALSFRLVDEFFCWLSSLSNFPRAAAPPPWNLFVASRRCCLAEFGLFCCTRKISSATSAIPPRRISLPFRVASTDIWCTSFGPMPSGTPSSKAPLKCKTVPGGCARPNLLLLLTRLLTILD